MVKLGSSSRKINPLKQGLVNKFKKEREETTAAKASPPTKKKQTTNNQKSTEISNHDEQTATTLWDRFKAELNVELFTENDTNNKTLLLEKSFYADRNQVVGFLKVFIFVFTITVFFHGAVLSPAPKWFMAYLTNWALTYAAIYQALSLFNTWIFNSLTIIKFSWVMFAVAAVHQIIVTILFWTVEYDPSIYSLTYYTIMAHGGVLLAVLVEGLLINRVPVRIKHVLYTMGFAVAYLIWTLIQNLAMDYNPYNTDDDDVALYDALSWKRNTKSSALFATLLILVFLPSIHLCLWLVSLPGRRYEEDELEREQQQLLKEQEKNGENHRFKKQTLFAISKKKNNKKVSSPSSSSKTSPLLPTTTKTTTTTPRSKQTEKPRTPDWWARPDPPSHGIRQQQPQRKTMSQPVEI